MELNYVIYIDGPPARVSQALRAGQPIAAFMPGAQLRSSFEPGAPYAYVGNKDGKEVTFVEGTIIRADDGLLEMTYRTAGNPHESRVAYKLEPAGSATKVSVKQNGFDNGDPNYEANLDGWPKLLSNLKSFIETGKIMNYYG